jgi:WD40 repeat protein/tRNA A-37 threonylcarbamoyl transferase component Bud32
MVDESSGSGDRDRQVNEIITAYLEAVDAGQTPDRQEWLRRYPEFAAELEAFWADYERVDRMAEPLRPAVPPDGVGPPGPERPASGDAPTLDSAQRPHPGPGTRVRYFGDYELLEEIGRGGMGVVYKARQASLNRTVALKMILAGQLASESDVKRFHMEAEAAANLDHPGIIPIYEVGQHQGMHYFSMGLVEGESLAAKVARGPLPPPEAADLVRTVAKAVHYAHQKGVIHRDLKPGNILLDREGQPRVTDFGLAKRVTGESELTTAGQVLGTPSYMPPEQAAGKLDRIRPASDVYALGAVLYTLVTGRPPFQAANPVDTLLQVLEQEPVSPRQLNARVPRDLETIALKCLEKNPQRRYATAQDLAGELESYLAGKPIKARPLSSVGRTWRWCRRKPVLAGLIASVAVLLAVIAIGSAVAAVLLRQERDVALVNLERAETAEQDALDKLWASYLAQARAGRWSGRTGQRFESLEALAKAAEIRPAAELRDEAVACMALADLRVARQVKPERPAGSGVSVVFDPAAQRYVLHDSKGTLSIHRLDDGAELFRLPGPGLPVEWVLRFSPNGQLLAAKYGGNGDTLLWDLRQRKKVFQTPAKVRSGALNFSPDSSLLAFGAEDRAVRIYAVPAMKECGHIALDFPPYAIEFRPGGRQIAVCCEGRPTVCLCDLEAGSVVLRLTHAAGVRGLGWSPNGRLLAAACVDSTVYVWDLHKTEPAPSPMVLRSHGHTATNVAFSPRGDLLVSYGWDGITRLWDPYGGRQLLTAAAQMRGFHPGPDGGTLLAWVNYLYSGGLYDVATGQECRTLAKAGTGQPERRPVDISPDGRLLATAEGAAVRLWDLVEWGEIASLPVPGNCAVLFQPDGKGLFTAGQNGLKRWPLALVQSEGKQILRVGPPESFPLGGSIQHVAVSPDGRVLAVCGLCRVRAVSLNKQGRMEKRLVEGAHHNAAWVSISPDGRWIASGTWKGTGVKVWDVRAAKLARDLAVERNASVAFSPDGKWLVTGTGEEYGFWQVGSWQRLHAILREGAGDIWGWMAFSPDGRVLAVALSRAGGLCLFDAASGRPLGKLYAPLQQVPACFSPDGSRLVVMAEGGLRQVWDLGLVRQGLAAMGLDWDLPPYAAPGRPPASGPIVAEVRLAADRYAVPTGGLRELTDFVEELRYFRPQSPEEQAEYRARARGALEAAAQRILELEKSKESPAYQAALAALLVYRARTITEASAEEQRQTVTDLKAHWAAKAPRGIQQDEAELAMLTAQALERAPGGELAVEAYRSFAQVLAASNHDEVSLMAKKLEGAARRLTSLGKDLELKGTKLDGSRFDWAACRGKVVLVDFWDTSYPYSRLEIAGLSQCYELYHGRGLEIVAVNVDEDRQKLERFLQENPLPWVVLHTDGAGWNHPMAVHYGVWAVPARFVVGRKGEVVSTQAHGRQLQERLEQLLGPPYVPRGNMVCIDLQSKTNQETSEVPRGEQILGGVKFQIGDGMIQMGGNRTAGRPKEVRGIRIDRRCASLYILHSAIYGAVPDHTRIGQYDVHYGDGTKETIGIVYGEDLRDWWNIDKSRPVSRGIVAWEGGNVVSGSRSTTLRLYLTKWTNPRPEKEVASIDYVSANTVMAPFCMAMTVEEPVAEQGKAAAPPKAEKP